MSSRRTENIEALSEWLESLQIKNKALEEYKWTDTEISEIPVPVTVNDNTQATMPKSMVSDLG